MWQLQHIIVMTINNLLGLLHVLYFVLLLPCDFRFYITKCVNFPYGYIHYCRYIVFVDIFVQYNLISYLQCLNISFYSVPALACSVACVLHSTDV